MIYFINGTEWLLNFYFSQNPIYKLVIKIRTNIIFQNETLKGQLKELWIKPEDKFYQYYQAGELNFKSPAFQSKKFLEDAGKEEIRKFTDELLKKIQEDLGTEIRLSLKTP